MRSGAASNLSAGTLAENSAPQMQAEVSTVYRFHGSSLISRTDHPSTAHGCDARGAVESPAKTVGRAAFPHSHALHTTVQVQHDCSTRSCHKSGQGSSLTTRGLIPIDLATSRFVSPCASESSVQNENLHSQRSLPQ